MPEEIEVDTDRLREAIDDEIERGGGALLRRIALTTAVLAALAAVAALEAGDTVNEALVLKTEATRLQGEASDAWSYYQAKGIKAAGGEATVDTWRAAQKDPPAELTAAIARHRKEQEESERDAKAREHERDERSAEADHLLHRHHRFAYAVALFQLAIALGAVAALTRLAPVWYGSIAVAVTGVACLVAAFVG